jgi:hypothetical protein
MRTIDQIGLEYAQATGLPPGYAGRGKQIKGDEAKRRWEALCRREDFRL